MPICQGSFFWHTSPIFSGMPDSLGYLLPPSLQRASILPKQAPWPCAAAVMPFRLRSLLHLKCCSVPAGCITLLAQHAQKQQGSRVSSSSATISLEQRNNAFLKYSTK